MNEQEIREQIRVCERKLDELTRKKRFAIDERDKAEDAMRRIRDASNKTEAAVGDAIKKIQQRIDQIMGKTKFRYRYKTKAEEILTGSDIKSAMSEYSDGIASAKRKYLDLDNQIDDYQHQIVQTKQRINDLKLQLTVATQEEGDHS